ncbi:hypothetical protein WJX84_002412 [Apatococcus fuscideae]|uniref:HP domain-containing protein n=1 Tax=Apatococcus fuscideae TaxID=2026836 RepID=A0AAW1T8Z5_9CHLO
MPAGNFATVRPTNSRRPEVWSVQGSSPVPLPVEEHGKFAADACYLVLHTQSLPDVESLNIHVWEGNNTSKDEAAAAAALAAELETALGSKGIQHRQVQGHESQSFLQAFNGRLYYTSASEGVNGAVRQKPVLLAVQMQGRRAVRVIEVASQVDSLHSSGCFILNEHSRLYAWAGSKASKASRASMLETAIQMSSDRAQVVTLEEQDPSSPDAEAFYHQLGHSGNGTIAIKSSAKSAVNPAGSTITSPRLFKVTDGSAGPLAGDACPGSPSLDMLNGEAAAMLVAGGMAYFWMSAATSPASRKAAFSKAEQILKQLLLPSTSPIQLALQGNESESFLRHLGKGQASALGSGAAPSAGAPESDDAPDASQDAMFADPKCTTTTWRVKGSSPVEVPTKQAAQFYSGNVYITHHSFKEEGAQKHFLFIWQGTDASQVDIEASGIIANAQDKKRCGSSATQVHILQGQEPSFFPLLFKGKAIFHQGNVEELQKKPMRPALYKLSGSGKAAQTQQVEVQVSSLRSSGCFLLLTPASTVFQWQSGPSSKDDQKLATGFANRLMPYAVRKIVVEEGQEPDAFWEALGGRGEYKTELSPAEARPAESSPAEPSHAEPVSDEARLLLCSDEAPDGLEDLPGYTQDDLDDEDVFLLDAFYMVFVWAGRNSDAARRNAAQKKAQALVQQTNGRAADTTVTMVQPGEEPSLFTAAFPSWNASRAAQAQDPYQRALDTLRNRQPPQVLSSASRPALAKGFADGAKPQSEPSVNLIAPVFGVATSRFTIPPEQAIDQSAVSRLAPASNAGAAAQTGSPPAAAAPDSPARVGFSPPQPGSPAFSNRGAAVIGAPLAANQESPRKAPSVSPSPPPPKRRISKLNIAAIFTAPQAIPKKKAPVPLLRPKSPPRSASVASANLSLVPGQDFVEYEALKAMNAEAGLDMTRKEDYLNDENFLKVFGQDRSSFKTMPRWRQQMAKKQHGLF